MKAYAVLLAKELRDIFTSRTALLLAVIISFMYGYSFYSAVSLYGNASVAALNNPLYAAGFEPVPGVFVPTFGGLFIIFSFFFPFLFIPLIGTERRNNTLTILLQLPYGFGGILTVKALAAIVHLFFVFLLSLPSLALWMHWGGHLPAGELFLVVGEYFIYGLLIISISLFASVLSTNTASASILAVAIVIASWLIDFGREMNIAPVLVSLSEWSVTRNLKSFEEGILSLRAVAYLFSLTIAFFAAAYFLLRFDLKSRWKPLVSVLAVGLIAVAGSSRITSSYDLSESRRNSFPPHIVRDIEKITSLGVDVYLERTDSRYKDYEKSFLKKLLLVKPDIKVTMVSGEALKQNYGLFVYKVNGKSDKTYSNSDEEIFQVIFKLAGIDPERNSIDKVYPGHPLVTSGPQQTTVIYTYFVLLPLAMAGISATTRLTRMRGKVR